MGRRVGDGYTQFGWRDLGVARGLLVTWLRGMAAGRTARIVGGGGRAVARMAAQYCGRDKRRAEQRCRETFAQDASCQ